MIRSVMTFCADIMQTNTEPQDRGNRSELAPE